MIRLRQICITAATLLALSAPTLAAELPAGMVKTSKGQAVIEHEGKPSPALPGAALMSSDRIVTGADGSVGVTLRDETLLSVGPNSHVWLEKFAFNPTTHEGALDATVKRGTMGVISGKLSKQSPGAVQFRTPSSVLGVRGTEFLIDVGAGQP
ncbi:FecR domain-containing protein [Rugamonas sp. CCM 8940]|uniref:FecR family protein n=1 Tax=Rugamonas sp. CCM 8940 TaxID=2765359 RepID=UPI0018F2BB41|nr:FecR domain-containing protein [Rugamonas sp. CCM 8940]MBJ7310908.1 FecR domain-containing protein [Rugamonas sp. CCM 8940]